MTAAQAGIFFFLQMAAIFATCRAVGWIAKRFRGQPRVVGQMIAGGVVGPSAMPGHGRVIVLVLASLGYGPATAIKAIGGGLAFAAVMISIAPA